MFEDTKGVIRLHPSQTDRQYNGKKKSKGSTKHDREIKRWSSIVHQVVHTTQWLKRNKRTNNDLQNTTQKANVRET